MASKRAPESSTLSTHRPTRQQEILVDAILQPGGRAISAWQEWQRHGDIDHLDPASFQVMSLLYWNLAQQGLDHPLMDKLKGIYRMTWSSNQWLISRTLPTLRALHGRGIPIMLLKGAALNALYGKQYGIRLIGDVDVLVRQEDALRAARVLSDLGWKMKGRPRDVTPDLISVSKGHGYLHPEGGDLDLHWHPFPDDLVLAHEEPVWRYAVQTPIGDVPTLAPSPTDLLLHVCMHGWAWSPHPPFRWIADAMTILRASQSELDWGRLISDVRRRRLLPRLEAALTYLRERFCAEIPARAMAELRKGPVPRLDRWEHRLRTRPVRTPLHGLILHALRFNRLRGQSDLGTGLGGFVEYLRRRWGLERARQVPLHMIARLVLRFLWSFHFGIRRSGRTPSPTRESGCP